MEPAYLRTRATRLTTAILLTGWALSGCLPWSDRTASDDGAVEEAQPTSVVPGQADAQDSSATSGAPPDTSSADVVAGTAPARDSAGVATDSVPVVAQEAATSGLESRLDLLISTQVATNRRLDSLEARLVAADSTAGDPDTLSEARDQVRGFGVGVAWSVVVLVLFNLAIRSVVWILDALAERNASRRLFYKRLVPIVRIVLWIFAAYLIVRVIFQVDAQGIVAAAAAVGVAVGFAAQDLLKNLFGGLILVFDQPFQVGDKISVGGTYGEVVSIGLRSTRLVTPDDNLVSVPNAQVVDQQVANANAGELNCQVVTDLYLPGWADENEAKRIAFQAAASSKFVYQKKPIVTLVSDVFKETFLTRVRVKAYVLDPRLEFQFQSDVTERARAGFREAGLLKPAHMRWDLVRQAGVVEEGAPPEAVETRDLAPRPEGGGLVPHPGAVRADGPQEEGESP